MKMVERNRKKKKNLQYCRPHVFTLLKILKVSGWKEENICSSTFAKEKKVELNCRRFSPYVTGSLNTTSLTSFLAQIDFNFRFRDRLSFILFSFLCPNSQLVIVLPPSLKSDLVFCYWQMLLHSLRHSGRCHGVKTSSKCFSPQTELPFVWVAFSIRFRKMLHGVFVLLAMVFG